MTANHRYDRPVPFVVLDHFLARDELCALLEYTLDHERAFTASEVIDPARAAPTVDREHRRSLSLFDLGPCRELITRRIESALPRIFDELRLAPFSCRLIEAQLSATRPGEFFKRHTDNGVDGIRTRAITFTHYFHREPRAYTDGELRIYTSFVRAILTGSPIRSETIAPLQNRVVFFPSSMMHEVLPVRGTSDAFADSRFSVTGWLHRDA